MTHHLAPLPPRDACLFLDVDGTLIDITDSPFHTHADPALKSLLQRVADAMDGALALVSGRSIDFLDALFAPLHLPTAGLHGVERRAASGVTHSAGAAAPLDAARERLAALVHAHPGTVLEDKIGTIAVHYRMAPQVENVVRDAVAAIARSLGGRYHVQSGNMMFEIKPAGFSKGGAIEGFLREPPFQGRTPVFVGDDLTDLDGFDVVQSHGGMSVAVGDRVSAQHRLADPAAVREWLGEIASARSSKPG